jgi:hypothetical protein
MVLSKVQNSDKTFYKIYPSSVFFHILYVKIRFNIYDIMFKCSVPYYLRNKYIFCILLLNEICSCDY